MLTKGPFQFVIARVTSFSLELCMRGSADVDNPFNQLLILDVNLMLLEKGKRTIDLGLGDTVARRGVVNARLDIPEIVIVVSFVLEVEKTLGTSYRHFLGKMS